MKHIYLDEWFVNAGILGFKKVLDHYAEPSQYQVGRHSIKLDPSLFETFAPHFFEVLIQKYSKREQDRIRLEKHLEYARNSTYFSSNVERISHTIKLTKGKLKKAPFAEGILEHVDQLLDGIKKLKKEPDHGQLSLYVSQYLDILSHPDVHDFLTINYIRSVLGGLFGQPSFLNPSFKGTKQDFIQKFHADYVQPVIEECQFLDWLQLVPSVQLLSQLKEKKKDKSLSKIQKDLTKVAIFQVQSIGRVIPCSVQSEWMGSIRFEEMMFSPLGLSLKNENISWDSKGTPLISYMTRLLLFCSSIAFTYYQKKISNSRLTDQEYVSTYAFVNLDDSIQNLEHANAQFEYKRDSDNPYSELVYDLLLSTQEVATFSLQNIFFVELSNEGKNSKLHYFHVPKKLARFFKDEALEIRKIKDKGFKYLFIDEILKRNDPIHLIANHLRNQIQQEKPAKDCLEALLSRRRLHCHLRSEGTLPDKKLKFLYMEGMNVAKRFRDESKENQLQGISYRLLNACKAGNRQLFMDILMRMYMSSRREIPTLFLNVLHQKDLDFVEVGYSFLSGLQAKSDSREKLEEEKANE
ncbi:CRISPR-associated protein Cas8b1/Cst1, subtype I-B/TNEAP [Laceyella tengchongensis]|uniref:CRISPR-associated protein Cas8b1/Cst1, subtype I-B/TNEAP n=1 Tax=Laceyella tengchongensis TaxID=574699 RepID=A0AA45WL19_9BACL|nr:type I-B CRISPR-associated protein Cas8b1/Cst1 [Laceyella tengchongensis]SMP09474.1 CRISPR-associated protein Cas8b1/Cst1, subtype I-B/TNEAP [Laceyella tengchongensis]